LLLCPFVDDCSTSFALDVSKLYACFLWTRQLVGDTFSGLPKGHNSSSTTPALQALVAQHAAGYKDIGDFLSGLEAAATDPVLYWATASQGQTPRHDQILQGASSAEPDWSLDWFAMSESLFLSKAFSGSMHPMKVFPYFYKASESFDEDDITVTTLVTPNRFGVLRKLALRYEGMTQAYVKPTIPKLARRKRWLYALYIDSILTPT
jgi:glycosyltransferase-like protein LARGE